MRAISINSVLIVVIALAMCSSAAAQQSGRLGAWQNPDIGFAYDLKFDMHNAEVDDQGNQVWKTRGFNISTAELSIGADIDPYARIDFNAMFGHEGAEIHELFVTGHSLPMSFKARAGKFLASFGRWNQFHSHSMPFVSEPRILHEYLGGHLMSPALELSWLVPTDHYFEVFGSVLNGISGHSHDVDPSSHVQEYGPGNPPPGCHFHDSDLHCPDDPQVAQLYNLNQDDPLGPLPSGVNKGIADLAWLGRVQTSFEMGLDWSVDIGTSVVHQDAWRYSQRFDGATFSKTTAGVDVAVFWNPVEANLYRGLDFGLEYMRNSQQDEVLVDDNWVKQTYTHDGAFTWARYRLNRTWDFGAYFEDFAPAQSNERRQRMGGFITWNISHFQRIRLEYVADNRGFFEDDVNQVIIQFDGVIGYHTHGRQR